jgi:hypothetical protein
MKPVVAPRPARADGGAPPALRRSVLSQPAARAEGYRWRWLLRSAGPLAWGRAGEESR